MHDKKIAKKGQVTIFIIVAIIIVAVLVLIFLNRNNIPSIGQKTISPVQEIKNCVNGNYEEEGSLEYIIKKIENQGGVLNNQNYFLYEGDKIEYICFTEEYNKPCIMQKPLLKQSIENEILNAIKPRVKICTEMLKNNLEKKGFDISYKEPIINISIIPENIQIFIELDLIVKKDSVENYEVIKIDKNSNLYEHSIIASSIANFESQFGDSEITDYMFYYPELKIEKKKQGDGTTIYILKNKNTESVFKFASRSYAIPAGISGN